MRCETNSSGSSRKGHFFGRKSGRCGIERKAGTRLHVVEGATRSLIEVYLIGSTVTVPTEPFEELDCVERVVRVSEKYRIIGRHKGQVDAVGFQYQGLTFDQDTLHVLPGLCAVDTPQHAEQMFAALQKAGITTTRMGAYKPRTSPYDFQGLGKECLPWVFELAGKYGIRVIAMEITHESQIDEINTALDGVGAPTGVLLQIGTRNTQNFELLKYVGQAHDFAVMLERGFGITLQESLPAEKTVANARIPVFMAHGTQDPVIPLALARASRDKLQEQGYQVEWREYPMPHSVVMEEIKQIGLWLVKRFKSPIILA